MGRVPKTQKPPRLRASARRGAQVPGAGRRRERQVGAVAGPQLVLLHRLPPRPRSRRRRRGELAPREMRDARQLVRRLQRETPRRPATGGAAPRCRGSRSAPARRRGVREAVAAEEELRALHARLDRASRGLHTASARLIHLSQRLAQLKPHRRRFGRALEICAVASACLGVTKSRLQIVVHECAACGVLGGDALRRLLARIGVRVRCGAARARAAAAVGLASADARPRRRGGLRCVTSGRHSPGSVWSWPCGRCAVNTLTWRP